MFNETSHADFKALFVFNIELFNASINVIAFAILLPMSVCIASDNS